MQHYIFGYGSLVDHVGERGARVAHLAGYRRVWNVAMDNSIDLPGYRYFLYSVTGERLRVFVTFLNVEPLADGSVNGLLVPVDAGKLQELDQREQNYARLEVTGAITPQAPPGTRVYVYVGTPEARARFETGLREGRAIVSQAYYNAVADGFAQMGAEELERFRQSTAEAGVQILGLDEIRVGEIAANGPADVQ
jgi:cation transport regulator ChaC